MHQAPVLHWNVLVCVERASFWQPSYISQKWPCPKPALLCLHTPQDSSHTSANCICPAHCSGQGGYHLQADCPIEGSWWALETVLEPLEHRFLGPGTREGRPGQALCGEVLCFGNLLCERSVVRGRMGRSFKCPGLRKGSPCPGLKWVLCMPLNQIKLSVPSEDESPTKSLWALKLDQESNFKKLCFISEQL